MVRTRILLFLVSLILVPTLSYFVILFARGYRFQPRSSTIVTPTGLLAANSNPDSAQLFINGSLKTATNSTISLEPGNYDVEIKKDGFAPWKKTLRIDAEIVTRAWATLFPTVPSLRALTFSGATTPSLSPDGTKVAYLLTEKITSKLLTIDLSESALGALNRDSRLLSSLPSTLQNPTLTWSPDSKQILLSASPSAYLIDLSPNPLLQPVPKIQTLLDSWAKITSRQETQKLALLPPKLQDLLATSSANLIWSPKENKLMYTATASATIPENLVKQLPGSSTQTQSRVLTPGKIYVYDTEEDRNFLIGEAPPSSPTPEPKNKKTTPVLLPPPPVYSWFTTSSHLMKVEPGKITLLEYDSQNPVVVYAGPLESVFAAPYPSGKQLVILTNLNPTTSSLSNLYALSLK